MAEASEMLLLLPLKNVSVHDLHRDDIRIAGLLQ